MSDELRGVVVCHGRLAGALVEAAEQISGVTGALVAVSNTGCDRGALEERVAEAVGDGPAVVFVDLVERLLPLRRAQSAPGERHGARSSPASISPCWWISCSTGRSRSTRLPRAPPSPGGKAIRVP